MKEKKIQTSEVTYKAGKRWSQEAIDELVRLSHEDKLTAENLVESARDKNSPLHDFFEWNDTEAARYWRLHQARVLINEVKVVFDSKEMFAFESVRVRTGDDEDSRMYKPIIEIRDNMQLRQQLLDRALNEITYWKEKYQQLEELNPIFKAIKKVKK